MARLPPPKPSAAAAWRSIVRGNAPVRYERGEGEWVEIRSTRVGEQSVYEVASSRGQSLRCQRYLDALSAARGLRAAWDRLAKRPPPG
jgi:hypothetical protein